MYKDSQGDVWDSKTIGQVFTTEANQTNHDLYHNKNKIEGITTIANYRNKTVENIGGRDVPIGSWRKDIMVTDDEVIELIKSQEISGVSPNNTLQQCPICVDELKNIKGNVYYNKDIENKECMNPIFTSLVPDPANGYGMNIYTYDKFLEKSKNPKGDKLSNKFKDMLKAFGESIVNYAEGIENDEETEENKEEKNNEKETNDNKQEEPVKKSGNEEAEMNKADEENSSEPITIDDVKEAVKEIVQPLVEKIDKVESEIAELKGEEPESSEENSEPESQKSRIPKVKPVKEKLENVEMEKQKDNKVNHLGMPIKSTKELAKPRNQFHF